jgi:hypothetical protein
MHGLVDPGLQANTPASASLFGGFWGPCPLDEGGFPPFFAGDPQMLTGV